MQKQATLVLRAPFKNCLMNALLDHAITQQPSGERHGITMASCAGGFLTRVPVAALALSRGGGFTLAERVFMAASWVPKVLLWALEIGVRASA